MKSSPRRLGGNPYALFGSGFNLCVFWPLAKLTWKILPKEYVEGEPMVDGREETSGTGCTNLCVPALGHWPGNGFATLLAALQKAHSPHWVLI